MKKVTVSGLLKKKQAGEKITSLTAYDASFAKMFDEQGVDALLIGDSLGMVLQGEDDTLPVTIDDIAYHTKSVRRGTERAFVLADMPFMSYATPEQTYANAAKLMAAGASMVKMEGGSWLCDTIKGLNLRGVPVCGHLGLTPQSVHVFGGFKVQGREASQAEKLLSEMGLADRVGHVPAQLSGGEQQRVAIARALALEPSVLICDESVSMLDAEVQAEVLSLLRQLQNELGLAMIFVTHDLSVASGFCHWVIVLDQGKIVEEGPGDRIFHAPQAAISRLLVDASPRLPR